MATEKQAFAYKPLDANSIRLLRITGYDDAPHITLHRYPIDRCPAFIALSYAWGPLTPKKDIVVDGKRFEVRENLALALETISKALAGPSRANIDPHHYKNNRCLCDFYDSELHFWIGTKSPGHSICEFFSPELWYWIKSESPYGYFWIDAICIDQINVHERNHQVSLMSRIFSSAAFVLAWLGPSFEHVDTLFHGAFRIPLESANSGTQLFPGLKIEELKAALSSFLGRKYWSRSWIVQEVIFARGILLLCGQHTLPWELVAEWFQGTRWPRNVPFVGHLRFPVGSIQHRAASFIIQKASAMAWIEEKLQRAAIRSWQKSFRRNDLGRVTSTEGMHKELDFYLYNRGSRVTEEIFSKGQRFNVPLDQLIEIFHQQECADPRDKVFSLIALAHECTLTADYSATADQIYTEVMDTVKFSKRLRKAKDKARFRRVLRQALGLPVDPALEEDGWTIV
jgi:Heterokaryon incompatibility protein (HET)